MKPIPDFFNKLFGGSAQKMTGSLIAAGLSGLLILNTMPGAEACAPEFPFWVLYNDSRPGMPLANFAAGNLGILQTGYAKSYLCVAYRFLINSPLSLPEQRNILRLWRLRLGDQSSGTYWQLIKETEAYLAVREKILGKKLATVIVGSTDRLNEYSYTEHVVPDAIRRARARQTDLVKRYGLKSTAVKNWQSAQDIVFASAYDSKKRSLAPLVGNSDALLRACRDYQIAALAFYCGDYGEADKLFAKIAADKTSPFRQPASYMVARSMSNAVIKGADEGDRDQAIAYIEGLLKVHKDESFRQDLFDLLTPLQYQYLSRSEIIDLAAKNVLKPNNERFGSDVGDLTYSMDEMYGGQSDSGSDSPGGAAATTNAPASSTPSTSTPSLPAESKPGPEASEAEAARQEERAELLKLQKDRQLMDRHDLTDWLHTIQFCKTDLQYETPARQEFAKNEQKQSAAHALAMYRTKGTLPWLVATMSLNGLRGSDNKDILQAAEAIPVSSPAYLTAGYFIIDAQISAGRTEAARARLEQLLKRTDLPTGSRNLLQAQMLSVARNSDEYFNNAVLNVPEERHGYSCVPDNWQAQTDQPGKVQKENPVGQALEIEVADDFNLHLPLDLWLKACRKNGLDPAFRARLVRTTWLRAHLLGRRDVASALTAQMCLAFPSLASLVRQCDSQGQAQSKYTLAKICLRNFGMSPYLEGELERHGLRLNEFDYYNENFWVPISVTPKPKSIKTEDNGDRTTSEEYSEFADELCFSSNYQSDDRSQWLYEKTGELTVQYEATGISRLLSDEQKRQARAEAIALTQAPPAKFFGDAVFSELKRNSSDPDMAEMLYRLVKLAKWSPRTRTASSYSHRAHDLLLAHYSGSKWARQAPYWY